MPQNFVPPKIRKYEGKGDSKKYLNNVVQKKAFLNQYLSRKEGEASIQRLQDIRQSARETLKSYLARFTDEITYCEQVTDKEALSAPKGGLNMNTLFWRNVRSKNPSTYDELVEMMKVEIVNEEMINHRNRAAQGLPAPQRQMSRGPTSQISPPWLTKTLGRVQATLSETMDGLQPLEIGGGEEGLDRPRDRPSEVRPYCTLHRHYGHDTNYFMGVGRLASNPRNSRNHYYEGTSPRPSPPEGERRDDTLHTVETTVGTGPEMGSAPGETQPPRTNSSRYVKSIPS
ncbi:unnamed protein product [Fraxinus pennsylvanica]|uniref:Retrotransposon gag domain-containing protein n=1 Tax=Fraxinus pennsylvanica TaxID=56036 RepID=A0AAD1Z489_9LAMI|nr:unnamed protein product [Fraxinus pennsylvanica]